MEKRYLVVKAHGRLIGAFEDVKDIVRDDEHVAIRSSEGKFIFKKNAAGMYEDPNCMIQFDDYEYLGRRTVKRRFGFVPDRRDGSSGANITK